MKLKDTISLCLIAAQLICNVNATESNISTPTIDSLNKFGTTQVHVLRDCSFLVKNVSMGWYAEEGGYIFNATKTENAKGVLFFCFAGASRADMDDLLGAKKIKDQWFWTGTNVPFEANQNFHLYEFSGVNWSGIGNTNDEITGEETLRQRMFNFCLFQHDGPQVLCLYNVPVMNLNYPAESALEKIIAVLKSIEFVDIPTSRNVRHH